MNRRAPALIAASNRLRVPSMRRRFVASRSLRPARSLLGQRGQLMNDVRRMGGFNGGDQRLAVQGVGNSGCCAKRLQLFPFTRRTAQSSHLMSRRDERANEGQADGTRPAGDEDIHEVLLSRASRIARPTLSASVTASRIAVVSKSGRHCGSTWAT